MGLTKKSMGLTYDGDVTKGSLFCEGCRMSLLDLGLQLICLFIGHLLSFQNND